MVSIQDSYEAGFMTCPWCGDSLRHELQDVCDRCAEYDADEGDFCPQCGEGMVLRGHPRAMSLLEHTLKCSACRLRWLVFGGKPDKRCPYCGAELTRG